MADWVHCNTCFRKLQPNLKFFLKECGRIECQKCLSPTGKEESNCRVCNKPCKTMLLANNMKQEIQMYFKPIIHLLDSTKKVYEFQKKNQDSLFSHLYKKYNFAKNEVMKCYKVIDNQKKEISKMRALLKHGQFQTPSKFSTSTPMESQTSPMVFDASLSTVSNAGSLFKKHCVRPGFPQRISSEETQSFSTVTSLEHVVPGSRLSMVPTHKKTYHRSTQPTLMSQMLQNSQSRTRQN